MVNQQAHLIAGVDLDRVRAVIEPVLAAHAVELWDLVFTSDRAGWTLRVCIERQGDAALDPLAGVSLDDCAAVSRDVSTALDAVDDLIAPSYQLEVSSPGADRALRNASDFRRFQGQLARVKLRRPAPDGQRLLRGTLESATDGFIAVLVDGKRIEAPLDVVEEANLVFELGAQPKRGSGTKGFSTRPKQGASKR
jgi:ribosome maturation factor RimP